MKSKAKRPVLVGCVALAWALWAVRAEAHRLDQYLQATRLAVDLDAVAVEIDLTPGASLARPVFASIDADGDGRIDEAEGARHARRVLRALRLSRDGAPARLTLIESRYPELTEMKRGEGTIRLRASARFDASPPGLHLIRYRNGHVPAGSVYLVNALVPASDRIEITAQRRDRVQQRVRLEYRVAAPSGSATAGRR